MFRLLIFIFIFPLLALGQSTSEWPKDEQVKIYSNAIAEYIKAVSKTDSLQFDTLFIGPHSHLPDTKLPAAIQSKKIIVLTDDKAAAKPQVNRSFILINIVLLQLTKEKAEFMIVTFHKDFKPQHNCTVSLKPDAKGNEFKLDSLRFEYPYSEKK